MTARVTVLMMMRLMFLRMAISYKCLGDVPGVYPELGHMADSFGTGIAWAFGRRQEKIARE